jgi:uncharacterized protein YjbJ (UPF0337 family)
MGVGWYMGWWSDRVRSSALGHIVDEKTAAQAVRERGNAMSGTDEVKGRAKEAAGAVTGDDELKREGKADQAAGKVKDAVESVKDKVTDALHKDK